MMLARPFNAQVNIKSLDMAQKGELRMRGRKKGFLVNGERINV